jgi:hypothetical protein
VHIRAHDCLIRTHDCPIRAHDCLIRTHDCPIRAHDCLIRAHDCPIRAHDCLIRAHDCPIRAHVSMNKTIPRKSIKEASIHKKYQPAYKNACSPIWVTPAGMVTTVRRQQRVKASSLIAVTLWGIIRAVRPDAMGKCIAFD